jgi:hypothetical protein
VTTQASGTHCGYAQEVSRFRRPRPGSGGVEGLHAGDERRFHAQQIQRSEQRTANNSRHAGLPRGSTPHSLRHSVESERCRVIPVCLDLRLQIGNLLLGGGNGIGAGDEAARRSFLAPISISARASFAGSPDCFPFWAFQYATIGPLRSS